MAVGCDENEKMKSQIFHIAETTSTNDVLKKMLLKNALEEGFTVVADFQTAGRGQAAKSESERGKICCSVLFFIPPMCRFNSSFSFKSDGVGLAFGTYRIVERRSTHQMANDIYWHDKNCAAYLSKRLCQADL